MCPIRAIANCALANQVIVDKETRRLASRRTVWLHGTHPTFRVVFEVELNAQSRKLPLSSRPSIDHRTTGNALGDRSDYTLDLTLSQQVVFSEDQNLA